MAAEPPVNEYTVALVRGIAEHQARIDELVSTYAEGWSLERMPAVDRNVLRIGVYEVMYVDDVPDAVAVSEAMNLVRDLSTDESPELRQRRARQHRPQQVGAVGLTAQDGRTICWSAQRLPSGSANLTNRPQACSSTPSHSTPRSRR